VSDKLTSLLRFVQTEMGNNGARVFGLEKAFLTVKESCDGMVELFDSAKKESHGGKFWNYDGKPEGW
jgi:norsolorinic acid ketoreductase